MYHSALKGFQQYECSKDSFSVKDFTGFVFDIETDKIPDIFYTADVIYVEIPFIAGYKIFNERAEKKGSSFSEFTKKVLEICLTLDKPFYILAQKNVKAFENLYRKEVEISIHKAGGYVYTNTGSVEGESTNEILDNIFQKYDKCLDFTCGYGQTLRFAKKHGKKAIVTDFNKNCIGYIFENLIS